jgi:hypothetical protein
MHALLKVAAAVSAMLLEASSSRDLGKYIVGTMRFWIRNIVLCCALAALERELLLE